MNQVFQHVQILLQQQFAEIDRNKVDIRTTNNLFIFFIILSLIVNFNNLLNKSHNLDILLMF